MNVQRIVRQLEEKFPRKRILALPAEHPQEIICELEPSDGHPEYSVAVAVIDQSAPHYHRLSTEVYKVLKGELLLDIDGEEHLLKEGDVYVIRPGCVHSAKGRETWVECRSDPGWTVDDHILFPVP